MRETLFRGKDVKTGKWVSGNLIQWENRAFINFTKLSTKGTHRNKWIEINPETVGQYTGLKDRNSVKIFEDDILDCKLSRTHGLYAVCWDSFSTSFMFTKSGDIGESRITELATKHCAIVGNIHDNPELLKDDDR